MARYWGAAAAALSDVQGTWEVTVTNGSGTKVLIMTGTQATVWKWAQAAGPSGGVAPGTWWPVDIKPAAVQVPAAVFTVAEAA